jgi:uncharacterized protein YkwD
MRRLATVLTIVAAAGCATASPKPAPAPTTRPSSGGRGPSGPGAISNPGAVVDDVFNRTNNERRKAGLEALTKSMNLMRAAQIQADQMASARRLDHDLPGAAYPSLSSRLAAVSYSVGAAGENIGEGYRSSAEAVSGWMGSSGHRANILSTRYTEMGAGVATARDGTQYWAQVFGRPR